ncbi:hypothetical protein bAD24_I00335 [Burkholderia sp. AD24]|nr:hypothetical protein bAD24_I00335 [Burkholderia sp. AD24]
MTDAFLLLFGQGRNLDPLQMGAALITPTDVQESVRQRTGARSMENVAAAILERNGEVSVIRKAP